MAARKSARKSVSPANGGKKAASQRNSGVSTTTKAVTKSHHYGALPCSKFQRGPGAHVPISGNVISRAFRGIGGLFKSNIGGPNAPTTRNFAFNTFSGVAFFATHPSVLAGFGFRHGDRLQYGAGEHTGKFCIVIGLRGGALWVANDESSSSSPVKGGRGRSASVADDSTVAGTTAITLRGKSHAELLDCYAFKKVMSLTGVRSSDEAKDFSSTIPRRLQNFLQFAPDLELSIPELEGSATLAPSSSTGGASVFLAPTYDASTGAAGWGGVESLYNVTGGGIPTFVEEAGIFVGCQAFRHGDDSLIAESSEEESDIEYVVEEEPEAAEEVAEE